MAKASVRGGGHYDGRTIALHWITAALVAEQWIGAQIIKDFGAATRPFLWSGHVTLGVVLGLVLIRRILWRNSGGRHLAASDPPLLEAFANLTHWGLYTLMATVVALGLLVVASSGFSWFGLAHIPGFAPGDKALRHQLLGWHGTVANVILVVAGLHAAAALFHHYIWRDGVLRRMLPNWR